jgi:hypothetical protein
MSAGRFLYTPAAVRDFREIYAAEKLSRAQALEGLRKSLEGAQLVHTQAGGDQVFRSAAPREHYLLVGNGESENRPVLAVASVDDKDPNGWWLAPNLSLGLHPGAELRVAREGLGISVEELAQLIRLPRARLEAWERGEIKSVKSLRRLARLVGKLHETRVLARVAGSRARPPLRTRHELT